MNIAASELDRGDRGLMDAPVFLATLARLGSEAVIDRLAPHLTEARRSRIDAVLRARVGSLCVALEDPHDPGNAAAVQRTIEALGGGDVHVIGLASARLRSRRITRGTFYWSDTRVHADWDGLRAALPAGMRLAGACVDGAEDLEHVPVDRPLCLVFGNEQAGLTPRGRAACDLLFRIPMHGMAESLNLSVAAGIALHSLLARRRAALGAAGDLSGEQLAFLRARWYAKAVDPRLVRAALGLPADPPTDTRDP
ncbi:MAG: RNA methyltransferase [Myxococcales bacterium]|nr:RNA methyltransferase [Myxococcales bacterium]